MASTPLFGGLKLRNALTVNFSDIRMGIWRVEIEWKMFNIKTI
jgi:hypothetical protein